MVLAGQLPVRLLELLVRRRLGDAERLVVILEFHRTDSSAADLAAAIRRSLDRSQLARCAACASGALGILVHQRPNPLDRFRNREQPLHARQVDAAFVDQVLDQAQPLELVARIDAHAADRPRRPDQSEPLVLAQRLRVHVEQPRSHADKVEICFVHIKPA